MRRRAFLGTALAAAHGPALFGAFREERWDEASKVLERATASKQVDAAVLHVIHKSESVTRHFGQAGSADAMFLLGSISKPINVAAVMTLFDEGKFKLDDKVRKYLPSFSHDGRENVTIRHLLTHVSGLPDQLDGNDALRKRHAPLDEFIKQALRTPLSFAPGAKYQYSSMGILLAARIGELISGLDSISLVRRAVLEPLGMKHSVQGLGQFKLKAMIPCQMDGAAPESGGGDPESSDWNWNSPYWRELGAPWGGIHASAPDVGRFLDAFLHPRGQILRPKTAKLMIKNHNSEGLTPRGLGFAVGRESSSHACSDQSFGHTGSTGTLFWADPETDTICVVLTSLPRRAAQPHPRELASERVAASARR